MAAKKKAPKKEVIVSDIDGKIIENSADAKKRAKAKKAPAKIVPSVFELKVLDQVKLLQKEDYHIILECEGRKITIKKDTDLVSLLRTYKCLNIIGCKSGCSAVTIEVR